MKSVLVANRGEIAVRIVRSAQELGLRTIAIYSELDRDARHVRLADEAWNIGPAPAAESYLNMAAILKVASEAGAQAIHPGYGFLAENADFAAQVAEAGIVWVGPPPQAISVMGDKISSRRAAEEAGVASVPGTLEPLESTDQVAEFADKVGFPLAIKAAHGGGGKGLRVVRSSEGVAEAFEGAAREADAYFGNPSVYVERYLDNPRHIEAQIIVDNHGNELYLGERDCSVQRRHQKLIEETPAVGLSDEQRSAIGESALAVARACEYRNAGTVEFLVDQEGHHYFLEMNTRLQVEHTVTEMVTGLDLVKEQLRVAADEPLSTTSVSTTGHSIEFRINAEDPTNDFLPTPGQIAEYVEPSGPGVRVDSWGEPGVRVSQYYDNLVAKLIVWGTDRAEAIARGRRALKEFEITGISTTIPAHLQLLDEPGFIEARHHTRYLEELDMGNLDHTDPGPSLPEEQATTERTMTVEVGGKRFEVKLWLPQVEERAGGGRAPRRKAPKLAGGGAGADEEAGVITAPMQGTIVKVAVKAGERVAEGDQICVLEAMKMENEVKAPIEGELVDLRVRAGDTVTPGQVLAIVRA